MLRFLVCCIAGGDACAELRAASGRRHDRDPRHPLQDILPHSHEHGKHRFKILSINIADPYPGSCAMIRILATLSKISSLIVMSMANTGSKSSPLSCITDPNPRHPLQDILPRCHEHGKHSIKILSVVMCCGSESGILCFIGILTTLSKISSLVVMSMANTGSKSSPLTLWIRDPVLYRDPRHPLQDILPRCHEHGKHRFRVLSIIIVDPDPGSVSSLTLGSGIRNDFFLDPGSRILDPKLMCLRA
jgi:hypothetical protein